MKKNFKSASFEDIYIDILNELNTSPEFITTPRGVESKEITNLTFELTNPMDRMVWNLGRETNYNFAMKFFIWMLNGSSDFEYVGIANKNAKNFTDEDPNTKVPKNFNTAYGPRIKEQFPIILEELKRDKDSRRAVIHILEKEDLNMLGTNTKAEYPCTNSITFLIRDNKLNLYTHMRSNNMVKTIVYDAYNFTMFQEFVWKTLKQHYKDLELGSYHHTAVSAHYFSTEQELVDKILKTTELGIPL